MNDSDNASKRIIEAYEIRKKILGDNHHLTVESHDLIVKYGFKI